MAHLTALMTSSTTTTTATPARTAERRSSAEQGAEAPGTPRVGDRFESVAELGGWMRTAFLGVFAPEILLDDLNDEGGATGARPSSAQRASTRL
jgi:hypothetical protein